MPQRNLVARHAQRAVEAALTDTRVVVVLGARQVGKSTLLEQVALAERAGRKVLTLDDQAVRAAATADPTGFIATLDTPVAIDETQRVPELMTEIKLRVGGRMPRSSPRADTQKFRGARRPGGRGSSKATSKGSSSATWSALKMSPTARLSPGSSRPSARPQQPSSTSTD